MVNANDWRRWTATAAQAAASSPEVRSFADLSLAEWTAEWSRKLHAHHGRLPAPGTRAKAETALEATEQKIHELADQVREDLKGSA